MKHWRLFVIIGLLAAWWLVLQRCHGQTPFHNSAAWRAQQWVASAGGFNPETYGTPQAYWIFEDLPYGKIVTNWQSRIGSNFLTNTIPSSGGISNTLTTNGVYFSNPASTPYLKLSNVLAAASFKTNATFILLIRPEDLSTSPGIVLNAASYKGLDADNSRRFFWYDGATKLLSSAVALSQWYDLCLCIDSNTTAIKLYTNGVLSATLAATVWSDNIDIFGGTGGQDFAGYLKIWAVYAKCFDSTDVSNWHNWSTNRYKYSP